ncbi:MAG: B12-binding domain-containing radical SAM protein [Desulfosudaceae bacterium]
MNIVLINPRSRHPLEIQQKCFAPLNLMYLAASLESAGYHVDIIDTNAFGWDDDIVVAQLNELHPDIIGISLLSEIYREVTDLARAIRAALPEATLLFGGPHASALPEKVLRECRAADLVLRGESEASIVSLCEAITADRSLAEVPGLTFRQDDHIHHNPQAKTVREIDSLAAPARHLLAPAYAAARYFMILEKERPVETLLTSRGCPFQCRFCSNIPGRFRARSPENVLDEIVSRYDQGIRNFDIADANFTHDPDRVMTIFRFILKEKLPISFRFKSRTDAITPRLLKKARQAGAYLVSMGMESGAQEILDRMNKKTRLAANIQACKMVKQAGLKVNTGWILGFPGETPETLRQTIDLIVRLKPTTANIGWLIPYPGTPVYEEARTEGSLMGDWSLSSRFLPWVKLPWVTDREQIRRIQQRAWRRVYFRPYYMAGFTGEILRSTNRRLAAYAWQEGKKVIRPGRRDTS